MKTHFNFGNEMAKKVNKLYLKRYRYQSVRLFICSISTICDLKLFLAESKSISIEFQ